MLLIAEVLAPDADDTLDVVREAESILVQALFDDLVRTIPPIQRSTHTEAARFDHRSPGLLEPGRGPDGGRGHPVFAWARSPPGESAF